MKPFDGVTHVALPDRVLTVGNVAGSRVSAWAGNLHIVDDADNFRPYPPRKNTVQLSDEICLTYSNWYKQGRGSDIDETRALIAAAQAYLARLEETE